MNVDCMLDYELVAAEQGRDVNLNVRMKAPDTAPDAARKPLNLGLVIDRSGSMNGEKLDQTKAAIRLLIRHLGPEDLLSLVIYDDQVQTVFPPARVSDKEALMRQVARIYAGGMTNLSGGWLKGIDHVAAHASAEYINRILLLTDGLANQGITDPDQLSAVGRGAFKDHGIVTTTLGFGSDFNEDLLTCIARESGGNFYYIESADMAPKVFSEELGELLKLVAQNIEVVVHPRDPVALVLQWTDHPAQVEENGVRYRLGDAYAGETKSLLLSLAVPGLPELGPAVIADTEVHYVEILPEVKSKIIPQEVSVNLTEASEAAAAAPRVQVVRELGMQISARARKQAIQEADQGAFDKARSVLAEAADQLGNLGVDHPALEQEKHQLEGQAAELEQSSYLMARKEMSQEIHNISQAKYGKNMMMRERKQRRRPASPDESAS